jgi:protein-export membrane protein SecD
MTKIRIWALILLVLGGFIGYWVYGGAKVFKLGLDLNGGTHLTYRADVTKVTSNIDDTMDALRSVIEKRINLFGVSEPIVQVEKGGYGGETDYRLIVELPGVTNVEEAKAQIGKTPLLEFKVLAKGADISTASTTAELSKMLVSTGLTGQYITRAMVEFKQQSNEPAVAVTFNAEGKALFAKITKENIGNMVAILLDGEVISMPVVREEISGGTAQISGSFKIEEARELVKNLNYGALPVPIELVSTETVGPSLGKSVLDAGVHAGIIAFIVISIFLLVWYRLPGLVAIITLALYVILNLALFKLIPVTLTAAGIAAFILSIGMAVDANILIFERTKEELRRGKSLHDAVHEGFTRAWNSIRDSNFSSIITGVILYYFASTPVIKGFALVFVIGVLISMFTAITATRTMMYALPHKDNRFWRTLFTAGIFNSKK